MVSIIQRMKLKIYLILIYFAALIPDFVAAIRSTERQCIIMFLWGLQLPSTQQIQAHAASFIPIRGTNSAHCNHGPGIVSGMESFSWTIPLPSTWTPPTPCLSIFLGNRRVEGLGIWWRDGGWGRDWGGSGGGGGTLLPLGLPAGARWPSLSLGDLWEGHYEVWVAVTLTACDSTAPGTAVAARDPGPMEKGGGREDALEKVRTWGGVFRGCLWWGRRLGVEGERRWGYQGSVSHTGVMTSSHWFRYLTDSPAALSCQSQ